jgi:hypothetical protein
MDMLTLVGDAPSIDDGLEALLGAGDEHVRRELEAVRLHPTRASSSARA